MIIESLQNHAKAERDRLDEVSDAFVKFWINRDTILDVEDGGEHYDHPPVERNAGYVRGTWYLVRDPQQGMIRDLALDGSREDLMAALPLALRRYPSDRVILDISSETYGVSLTPRQANVFAKTGKTPSQMALAERETIPSGQIADMVYYVNPTGRDLLGLMQTSMRSRNSDFGDFRALVVPDGTVYAWDAFKGAHWGVWKDLSQQGYAMGSKDEVICIHVTWVPDTFRTFIQRTEPGTRVGSILRGSAYTLTHARRNIGDIPAEHWQMAFRSLQRLARVEEKRIEMEVRGSNSSPSGANMEQDFAGLRESEYDPKARYNEFNRAYFGGELPDIPVVFKKSKGAGGHANISTIKSIRPNDVAIRRFKPNHGITGRPETMYIAINNIIQRSPEAYDGILLHEMIHIWQFTQGIYYAADGQHGASFMKKLRELEQQFGIKIPATDNFADGEITDDQLRPFNVGIMYREGQPRAWCILADKAVPLLMQADRYSKGIRFVIKRVTGPEWTKIGLRAPMQRPTKASNVKMFVLNAGKEAAVAEFEQSPDVLFSTGE